VCVCVCVLFNHGHLVTALDVRVFNVSLLNTGLHKSFCFCPRDAVLVRLISLSVSPSVTTRCPVKTVEQIDLDFVFFGDFGLSDTY